MSRCWSFPADRNEPNRSIETCSAKPASGWHGSSRPPLKSASSKASPPDVDIDATAAAVVKHGGKIIMPKCEIPTVGHLIKIQDTDDNVVRVKQPAST